MGVDPFLIPPSRACSHAALSRATAAATAVAAAAAAGCVLWPTPPTAAAKNGRQLQINRFYEWRRDREGGRDFHKNSKLSSSAVPPSSVAEEGSSPWEV